MYDQIVTLISNVDFPIAVYIYLLINFNSKFKLGDLTKVFNKLAKDIEKAMEYQNNKDG